MQNLFKRISKLTVSKNTISMSGPKYQEELVLLILIIFSFIQSFSVAVVWMSAHNFQIQFKLQGLRTSLSENPE